ncbi:MAG TPA: MurT ligase domain-containing protein [Gaiellales bacterium]|nr:MurT ligase domain-containing protein [Gaiellales bacterium]
MSAVFQAKVAAARTSAALSRRFGAGGGTTLPGRLLLAAAPDAIGRLARELADGSIALSATNGKTTTAKMLAAMLEPPLAVCANRAGANLGSGVASALLDRHAATIGVFEVDEAALPAVAAALKPRVLALGNLFRDQLDRYGELELVGEGWQRVCASLLPQTTVVRIADDPLVASLDTGSARTIGYGLDDPAAALGDMQHASDSKWCARCGARLQHRSIYLGHLGDWLCPSCGNRRPALDVAAAELRPHGLEATEFRLRTPLGERPVRLTVPGLYNVYNALAATAAAIATGLVGLDRIVQGLERFDAAFGRFERLSVNGRPLILLLAKNPAGANELLRTLAQEGRRKRLLVALNDRVADGRDISWIWDVDVEQLAGSVESLVATGGRAAELALRFKYAGIADGSTTVIAPVEQALDAALAGGDGPLYVLATYTAMLELRAVLTRRGVVAPYWSAQ